MTRTVWLASYPKSGNTWFRIVNATLAAGSETPADINDLSERGGIASARGPFDHLTLIDSGLLSHDEVDCLRPRVYEELARGAEDDIDAANRPEIRLVKVHDAYTTTPLGEPLLAGARGAQAAIVIVRDPRAVAPSLANHNRSTVDEAISFMNAPGSLFSGAVKKQPSQLRQKLLDWSSHVASWLDQRDIPVHLLRYEDLRVDPVQYFLTAMTFAGREVTLAAVEKAVALSDFATLQAQEREKGFREAPRTATFFRRGQAEAWREELTTEQIARIEAAHAPMMARLGYDVTSV